MKKKNISATTVRNNLPTPSEEFFAATMTRLEHLATREAKPMKRKAFSSILVAAVVLVMLAATAFAAYTLTRSKQADAISKARAALTADYGLTSETIGLFFAEASQDDDGWTIIFRPEGYHPSLLGEYTVILSNDKTPETSWTHDAVDPSVWQDGSLDSPVWGQPQMRNALLDPKAASAISANMDWSSVPTRQMPSPDRMPKKGEAYCLDEIVRVATPGPSDIPQDKATAMAIQALMEETSLSQKVLEAADAVADFYERDVGNPLWSFHFYLLDNGVEQGCAVVLDAHTGEILLTAVVTGNNG